ncbi:MAG TPA: PEP-CTERM system histidine kinase PrsK [Gammaproteobacteria bacterium]|nr:PEP-CTERM system histidine kinase PrsK [Gammaproteobacteria bacterium]
MEIGFYSYLSAAIAYGFFAVLLLFSWRSSMYGKLLFIVIAVSAVWAFLAGKIAAYDTELIPYYQVFELLRYMAWYIFLLKLFEMAVAQGGCAPSYRNIVRWVLPMSVGFACLLLANYWFSLSVQSVLGIAGQVFLALFGLAIIEQLYRNTSPRYRWATKYLFLGAGGIFVFDFYFYADALLFRRFNQDLWDARGIVNLIAVPLLAISSARNKNWSMNVFVSREIVFNTTAIIGGGIYLLLMSAAGYYIRVFGGDWGRFGQVAFFSLAVVLLAAIMFSGQVRARLKVFLAKHFYKNKYDYRIEWLRLTEKLSEKVQRKAQFETAITALAHAVDAQSGQLWLHDGQTGFCNVASWGCDQVEIIESTNSSLIHFFEETGYLINLMELDTHADEYEGLVLPEWLQQLKRPWLLIPLQGQNSLLGFIVLANPLVVRSINWEDRDLLKTAAKQVANHLAVLMTSDALSEAKQFEVFTRLSAYMVHDLKNIASELEMVALNAKKHKSNPAFIEDAFETVDNAAGDIKRLLEQLRNKQLQSEKKVVFELAELVAEVVVSKQAQLPQPKLDVQCSESPVIVERDRLANVLAHLIDNAQQATDDSGSIEIKVYREDMVYIIEIKDSGHGMDADFIRDRLFRPFDTTKGNAGMGIGMHESRDFVRSVGGNIHVQSKPGKGSIISLHVPVTNELNAQE